MELLEKMRKDKEEKEAQATKFPSVETHLDGDKGKGLMEHLPKVTIAQQLKALMHTSKQSKQKLTMMTSVLDTQEVASTQTVADIQVTTVVTQPNDD